MYLCDGNYIYILSVSDTDGKLRFIYFGRLKTYILLLVIITYVLLYMCFRVVFDCLFEEKSDRFMAFRH